MYVKAVVTTSAEDRRVSVAQTLELFDCEAGLAEDAAQGTDGELLVARGDHDDGRLMAGPDDAARIHAVHVDVVHNGRRGRRGCPAG